MARTSLRIQDENNQSAVSANIDGLNSVNRKRTTREEEPGDLSSSEENEDQAAKPDKPASKKKKKMPQQFRKVKGRFGLLERLAKDAPVEIFLEIFTHLDPGDLLRLARTSKELRNMLMSKSSESIWRATRSNVEGIPPLPDDLSEPQYAHLLFSQYCDLCLKGTPASPFWDLRARCCGRCIPELRTTNNQVLNSLNVDPRLKPLLLRFMYFKGNVFRTGPASYHTSSVARKYQTEFAALQGHDEQEAWLQQIKNVREKALEHRQLCYKWANSRYSVRTNELKAIRNQRKADILDRLEEFGWREEAELMINRRGTDPFSKHKLVNQGKKLTDRVWNNMKTELVQMLSKSKRDRGEQT
ncbi:hypothetical protein BT96DRAFT_1015209 [Gymnopus androsaceus JB14]|uniref:F-box domain-containing protein n=1 Tax=Gymnopus androsaceus JB14 TaxID=1447944 RepID=A0A6A4I5F8_9AGAR|nr:hypothetical protein BT96DRAFT_1015209 [Gymnopus androsaceus JB14]